MLKSMELAKVLFIKAFFISFVALAATDLGLLLYSYNTGSPLPDWGVLGRWFVILLHGQFYVPHIAQQPPVSHEHFIGLLLHQFTAFVFVVLYLCVMRGKSLIAHFYGGPLFGVLLAIFPLFFQLPSMGLGFLAWKSGQQPLIIARVFVSHFFLGLGLAIGFWMMAVCEGLKGSSGQPTTHHTRNNQCNGYQR